jgi:hypothetical protein
MRDAGRQGALMPTTFRAPRWREAKRRCTHCERACRRCVPGQAGCTQTADLGQGGYTVGRHAVLLGTWDTGQAHQSMRGEVCAAVGAAKDGSTWKHPGRTRSRRSLKLSSPLLFGFAVPPLTILSVRHAVCPHVWFSLLQSGHVFHLDAEMYSCSSVIVPFSSRTCEMMPIANEVPLYSSRLPQACRNSRIR